MASAPVDPADLEDARRFLRKLRKAADRGSLGLDRPEERGISQPEAAKLISKVVAPRHVNDRRLRELESLVTPWPPAVAEAYAGLLQLHGTELDIFHRIVDRRPPTDTPHADLVQADVHFLHHVLVAPSYFGDEIWDMRDRNEPMARFVPRFRPGINIFEYTLTDPEAREVLVDWGEMWAKPMVMQFRSTLLKSTGSRFERLSAIARRCREDKLIAQLWEADLEPRLSPNGEVRRIRPADPTSPTGLGDPVRVRLYSVIPASKPTWRFMSLIPLDELPVGPEVPVDDRKDWFPGPELLHPNWPQRGPGASAGRARPGWGGSGRA